MKNKKLLYLNRVLAFFAFLCAFGYISIAMSFVYFLSAVKFKDNYETEL